MNILVTGANGQLGNEMRIIASRHAELVSASDNYIFTDVNQVEGLETTFLDITDLEAIKKMVSEKEVKVIVNCAAWTNVDACETDEKLAALAEKLNAEAPKNLAIAMKEIGGLLIHVSTDYVFGQEPYNTPCNPDQKGTPTGVYGATKKRGEENILATGCNHIILRTAWLYSEFGKNFCKTMLNLTATKPQLKVVFDQCGTPTYAYDLAEAIDVVINDWKQAHSSQLTAQGYAKSGIYHYSNEGVTSWYDFTKMIQRLAVQLNAHGSELITQCDIQPCYSCDFPSPVTRPSYSVLDKSKIKEAFGIKVPYWVDSLEVCLNNIKTRNS